MQVLYPKVIEAKGLIFGSPSYFASVTAQAKTVIDRLYCLYYGDFLVNKVAGVISVAGSWGNEGVNNQFNKLFRIAHMFPADYAVGFAGAKGEVKNDDYAMKSAEELGKQITSLIKQQLSWPQEFSKAMYRYVNDKFGIESYPLRQTQKAK
jgi:multimeric flavodoxin WrbA